MEYLRAFIVGGLICVVAQIIMDTTKLTPAHILVIYVTSGVILTAVGIYEPLINFAGAGASVPLTGFGYALCKGVFKGVDKSGLIGAFTGGLEATAGGIAAAIIFGYIMAVVSNPKTKN
ncbi:stage V sporulation protein AE [Sporanaerobacter acetigenes]|uniref:Stage V sporulation protein AE n=1 Tax=Sporanaerobacter acetigenes DSM 13106 TaxID=1123281 RepID=A0A1M5UM86_9FIRM|nr:stage V sporulation protein AE [Sporanaerobacter acetigenes]SHH63968.1 stage V sporulation protein AE [Sporanaerobacter acetigenes DSM 13106]